MFGYLAEEGEEKDREKIPKIEGLVCRHPLNRDKKKLRVNRSFFAKSSYSQFLSITVKFFYRSFVMSLKISERWGDLP